MIIQVDSVEVSSVDVLLSWLWFCCSLETPPLVYLWPVLCILYKLVKLKVSEDEDKLLILIIRINTLLINIIKDRF